MSRILAIIPLLLSFASFAQASAPSDQAALLECDQLTFEADELECIDAHCTLSGNALVTCGETSLKANRVILSFDPQGSFQGSPHRKRSFGTAPAIASFAQSSMSNLTKSVAYSPMRA